MKILVAEDSRTNMLFISEILHKLGDDVVPASSGEQAVALFQKEHPDLVILDVMMEGMDGFETARQIRKIDGDSWIPIIFLSSSVDDISIAKGINAGGDDYLAKPISDVKLEAKIKAMQRISDMQRKLVDLSRRLSVLSSTDPLTGIYNRLHFDKAIKEKISSAKRNRSILAMLYIDIDHFKKINDTLGHHMGDMLLNQVVQRLKGNLREEDFVARLGGDEFAVLIENVISKGEIEPLLHKIVNTLSESYKLESNEVTVSASVGVSFYPINAENPEDLIHDADIAMYHAKKLGRNNFQYYSSHLNEKMISQSDLENFLKFAIDRNQLFLRYQPIFNLVTKKIIGVEALMRWNHPTLGEIMPDLFIPIAEQKGFINSISEWLFRSACGQVMQWSLPGEKDLKLYVNFSLEQLMQKEVSVLIYSVLAEMNFPVKNVGIEITEKSINSHSILTQEVINEIAALGIELSIDDFGSAYSSLTYLNRLPIKTLKIDKSLVIEMAKNKNNRLIIKSIIELGRSLGLQVIAEGIETKEQLQFLIDSGCQYGQGFYLGEPLQNGEMRHVLELQGHKNEKH